MQKIKNPLSFWRHLPQWKKVLFAMVTGICLGFLLGNKALCLKPVGILFINAIKMLIVPVVFTSIVCAILAVDDSKKMRRVSLKTLAICAISLTISTIIGLSVAAWMMPGNGLSLPLNANEVTLGKLPTVAESIVNIIPTNILAAFGTGNILQLLILSILIGLAMNAAGESAEPAKKFFLSLSAIVFKLTSMIMHFVPYGIFALMAATTGEYGIQALFPLFKLILTGYLACLLLGLIFYTFTLKFIARLNPSRFYKGISSAIAFAFSTSSSTATLPISVRCAEENLGVSRGIAGFLLPLGATLNLNGLAIYLSIAVVFAANVYGVHLGLIQYLTLLATIVLTSMSAGGSPGSALVVMGAVMSAISLPLGTIPLIAGIDWIIDMGMTATNVVGGLFATVIIAKSENELDHGVYDNP